MLLCLTETKLTRTQNQRIQMILSSVSVLPPRIPFLLQQGHPSWLLFTVLWWSMWWGTIGKSTGNVSVVIYAINRESQGLNGGISRWDLGVASLDQNKLDRQWCTHTHTQKFYRLFQHKPHFLFQQCFSFLNVVEKVCITFEWKWCNWQGPCQMLTLIDRARVPGFGILVNGDSMPAIDRCGCGLRLVHY